MRAVFKKSIPLLLTLALNVAAQGIAGVSVPVTSPLVVLSQNGVTISSTFSEDRAGFQSECGGTMVLNSSVCSTMTLTFSGTMVQVNFVYANTGGLVDLYLDGTIWMSVDTYAAEDVTSCDQYLVANSTLPDGSHTLAVINADPSSRTHLTGFVYSSSSTSTSGNPTSTSSQSSSPKTSKSLTPIIVSAVGGLVVLIVFIAIVIWLVRRSSRASQSTPETHDTKHASLAMYDDRTSKYQAVSLRNYSISHSPISPPASSPGFGEISTSDYPPQSPISEQSPRTSLLTSNQRQQERSSVGMDSFGHRGSTGFAQEQTQPATQNTWTPEKWNPNRIAEDVGPSSSAGGGGGGGGPVGWGPPPAYGDERGGNRR